MTAANLVYPVFLLFNLTFSLILIPRDKYQEYLMYGFLVGGLGDIILVTILQNFLGLVHFKNQGIFYVLGHHALSPLGWTLAMMLFLYFMPKRQVFLYFYTIAWSVLSLGFGYVVHNAQLFEFRSWFFPLPAYIMYLAWWIFAVQLFQKTSTLAKPLE